MPRFYLDLKRHRDTAVGGRDAVDAGGRGAVPGRRGAAADAGRGRRRVRPPRGLRRRWPAPASGRSASSCVADDAVASKTVTAAWIPDGLDWKAFNGALKRRGLVLAGGQGKLKGRIFRLGHLGSVTTDDVLAAIGDARGRAGRARAATSTPGVAVAAAQQALLGPAPHAGRDRLMRILVVEPLAPEGLELLRRHHEVDERLGLPREEIAAILPEYDALVVRSQVKVDAELIAAGHAARRHRPGGRRRRQRRPRGGDPGRDRRRQRAHRQHDRRRGADARAAVRARPPDRGGRRLDAPRRVEAVRSSRASSCAARRWASSAWARSARRSRAAPRALQMTVLGADPFVTHEQAASLGVELVPFDDLVARSDAITVHVPKTKATTGLINAKVIDRMKPGVMLLNVARGGVIDEAGPRRRACATGTVGRRRHRRVQRRAADRRRRCSTRRTPC